MKTADELVAEGKRLRSMNQDWLVVILHPSQEWMAVELQTPFARYEYARPTSTPLAPLRTARRS